MDNSSLVMPLSSQVSVRQTISGLRSTHSIFKNLVWDSYKLLTLNRRRINWDVESEGYYLLMPLKKKNQTVHVMMIASLHQWVQTGLGVGFQERYKQ